jgi:hypothetical protein
VPDYATFGLHLITAEGTDAIEPKATVNFTRPDGQVVLTAPHVVFPPARTFRLPAYPAENFLFCDLTFSLYHPEKSDFFIPQANSTKDFSLIAVRDASQWDPMFPTLGTLAAPRFDAFKFLLAASNAVDLKNGPVIGDLANNYDALVGEQAILAKTCLLNLYAVLTDEVDPIQKKPSIRFVQKILRIDRERFVAEIDKALFDTVMQILNNLDQYKEQGFFTESAALHYDNIPSDYVVTTLQTVKVRYMQGNVQFTVAPAQHNGNTVYLLDCDMDEDSNLILHTEDLFTHLFTGGTDPIDMHEYIVRHSALLNGGLSTVDLGYTLDPHS